MRVTVIAAGAILGAATLVGGVTPAGAHASAPDPYSPSIKTDCRVSVPAAVRPGKPVVISIRVTANSPTQPSGDVEIVVSRRPGDDRVWSKTVGYNGGTKKVVGPALDNEGNYAVTSRFRSGNDAFARCRGSVGFEVDALGGGGSDPDGDGDNGPGGLLPDTGGPALLWLLLGTALVGGGTATVVYSRRRTGAATA